MRPPLRRGEDGTAVWVTPFVGLLAVAALVLAFQGGVLVAQRRVQSDADLAALAGASALQRGDDGCGAAGTIARRNGASLQRCAVHDQELLVTVGRAGPRALGHAVQVRASARAGPAQVP